MAEIGFSFAIEEICLVLFTTLAPTGIIALLCLSPVALRRSRDAVALAVFGALACGITGAQALGKMRPALAKTLAALAAVFVGLFAVRISFYTMHMTAGLGL